MTVVPVMVAMVSPCRFVTAHEVRLGAAYPFVYRTPPGRVTYRSAALDDPVDPVDGDTLERGGYRSRRGRPPEGQRLSLIHI